MWLRALVAQPIPEIALWVLVEIDNVGNATIDREIARAGGSGVPMTGGRPAELVLRAKIDAVLAELRTET